MVILVKQSLLWPSAGIFKPSQILAKGFVLVEDTSFINLRRSTLGENLRHLAYFSSSSSFHSISYIVFSFGGAVMPQLLVFI